MIDFACKTFNLEAIIKCSLGLTKADYSILIFLIGNDEKWHTTQDIAGKTKLDLSTVQRSIKKLHEKNIVKRNQENLNKGGYIFIYKITEKQEIRNMIKDIIQSWSKNIEKEINKW